MTPLACCTEVGTDLRGLNDPQATAFDHRRTAHPDVRVLGGDDHVADAEHRRVAGEAVPGVDADQRYQAAEPGEVQERPTVEQADTGGIGVARAPTSTLGEEHDRQTHRFGQVEQAVLLAMVLLTLGTRQDRVVVRDRDHLRRVTFEQITVDGADAPDHAVSGGALDELVEASPPPLSCDHQRSVLDERTLVDQVGDVLARRAPTDRAAAFDRLRASRVETDRMARLNLRQIGSNRRWIGRRGSRRGFAYDHTRCHDEQRRPGRHRRAHDDQHLGNGAVARRLDGVMHLHRLDQHQLLAGHDGLAGRHVDGDDRALHRSVDTCVPHSSDGSWRDGIRLVL